MESRFGEWFSKEGVGDGLLLLVAATIVTVIGFLLKRWINKRSDPPVIDFTIARKSSKYYGKLTNNSQLAITSVTIFVHETFPLDEKTESYETYSTQYELASLGPAKSHTEEWLWLFKGCVGIQEYWIEYSYRGKNYRSVGRPHAANGNIYWQKPRKIKQLKPKGPYFEEGRQKIQ